MSTRNFYDSLKKTTNDDEVIINSLIEFVKQKCIEQKKICVEHAHLIDPCYAEEDFNIKMEPNIDIRSILCAPLPNL